MSGAAVMRLPMGWREGPDASSVRPPAARSCGPLPGAALDQLGRDRDPLRRAVVAVEPCECELRGAGAELPGVGADDRDAEQVGELEVVEADQRDFLVAAGERVQRADRVAVVGGE